jgi:hypothetical protein
MRTMPQEYHENGEAARGGRLVRAYAQALVWYFLAMIVMWVVGFESIYDHPTPFYALYLPAFSGLFVPGFMAGLMWLSYWGISAPYRDRSRRRDRLGWAAGLFYLAALLAGTAYSAYGHGSHPGALWIEDLRLLAWHLPALGVFLAFLSLLQWAWPRLLPARGEVSKQDLHRFLAAAVLFAFLFPCAVAMIRNGFEGIAQSYRRETYEYIGDIGVTSGIRALFGRYLSIQPYLSLHGRVAPPGPTALLWLLSYVVGRSALGLALATVAAASLSVIPLFFWARDLMTTRVALVAVCLFALMPSIVLFSATSAEMLFMPFSLTTLFLFDRALRRNAPHYAIAAGIAFGMTSLLKFSLLGLGAYFALAGLARLRRSETRRAVFVTATVMGASFVCFHLLVWWWSGFDVIAAFFSAKSYFDLDQVALDTLSPRFPGWTYRFLNPLAWFYFAGIPVSMLFLMRLWRQTPDKGRFWLFAATLLALNLLYLGRGEGERSAIHVMPFIALPAAHLLDEHLGRAARLTPLAATLAFLAFQCWLTEAYFYTYW